MRPGGELRIGTSGWNYGDWSGAFYPEPLKNRDYLSYYAQNFGTVEVNYSFYHLPRPETYLNWAGQTPEGFVFAVKASRVITHINRLRNVEETWRKFLSNAEALGQKLGPVLLQFPPSFRVDLALLRDFLDIAGQQKVRLAFEFRHASWFRPAVAGLLRERGAALVIAQSSRYPQAPLEATAPFVYLRFHGPERLFGSSYNDEQLRGWAARIREWLAAPLDVYVYFNNDFHGYALANARTLAALL
ncbi:MAG: DUF72 domain-containing protein [Acidobacteriales bacterium]|nr:DUF72 domain-containing protein [Terriglobales bacterium]